MSSQEAHNQTGSRLRHTQGERIKTNFLSHACWPRYGRPLRLPSFALSRSSGLYIQTAGKFPFRFQFVMSPVNLRDTRVELWIGISWRTKRLTDRCRDRQTNRYRKANRYRNGDRNRESDKERERGKISPTEENFMDNLLVNITY